MSNLLYTTVFTALRLCTKHVLVSLRFKHVYLIDEQHDLHCSTLKIKTSTSILYCTVVVVSRHLILSMFCVE